MRNTDFSPLYRSAIGFDHLSSLLEAAHRNDSAQNGYPPYNIELLDSDQYQITMALAGFSEEELEIQTENQTLTVSGNKRGQTGERNFLHQGIAARNFERKFQLAEHVEVTDAKLENGLLHVNLVRKIPEAMKPKNIPISGSRAQLKDVSEDAKDAA